MSDEFIPNEELTAPRKRGRPPTPQTCGNCRHIRFSDAQILTFTQGTCARSNESGRFGVRTQADGCPMWERRSPDRKRSDEKQRARVAAEVDAVNAVARRRRRF